MSDKYSDLRGELEKSFKRFQDVMQKPKDEYIRDSAIQRFEFTFELVWKTIKVYLKRKGLEDFYFPRDVIKEAFRAGIIEEDERWLDMLDTRNATSHIYKESMAEDVYKKLPAYLDMIKDLLKKI